MINNLTKGSFAWAAYQPQMTLRVRAPLPTPKTKGEKNDGKSIRGRVR